MLHQIYSSSEGWGEFKIHRGNDVELLPWGGPYVVAKSPRGGGPPITPPPRYPPLDN